MNWSFIQSLIQQGKSNQAVFFGKVSSPDHLGPSLVGLANTDGGHIVIGLDIRNLHLFGTFIDKSWIQQVIDNYCFPRISASVNIVEKGDHHLCLVSIEPHPEKPIYYKNTCYVMDNAEPIVALQNSEAAMEPTSENEFTQDDIQKITDEMVSTIKDIQSIQESTDDRTDRPPLPINNENSQPPSHNSSSTQSSQSAQTSPPTTPSIQTEFELNERQQKTLRYLDAHQTIQNRQYRELFTVSHKTAHIELVQLVDHGLIESKGSGRSTHYVRQYPS